MQELKSHICPYCGKAFPKIDGVTYFSDYVSFTPNNREQPTILNQIERKIFRERGNAGIPSTETVWVYIAVCPDCLKASLSISAAGGTLEKVSYNYPPPNITNYPEYIPEQIRRDYSEAALIIDLSPKASATLSRRCLQGIIRDFWGITPEFWDSYTDFKREVGVKYSSKANLWQEIKAVEHLGGVSAPIVAAFKQLKDIGNIGAHPEMDVGVIVDVEPGEAETLVKLIELIIQQTYIQRNSEQELLKQVEDIALKKAKQRGDRK